MTDVRPIDDATFLREVKSRCAGGQVGVAARGELRVRIRRLVKGQAPTERQGPVTDRREARAAGVCLAPGPFSPWNRAVSPRKGTHGSPPPRRRPRGGVSPTARRGGGAGERLSPPGGPL